MYCLKFKNLEALLYGCWKTTLDFEFVPVVFGWRQMWRWTFRTNIKTSNDVKSQYVSFFLVYSKIPANLALDSILMGKEHYVRFY